MSRRLSQPPRRGESRVTAAKKSPIAKNNNKYVNGANQTKCRLMLVQPVGRVNDPAQDARHRLRAIPQPVRTRLRA